VGHYVICGYGRAELTSLEELFAPNRDFAG
jgi:hypothetical protein